MNGRVPIAIRDMINAYLKGLDQYLPDLVIGVYLHGSVSLDAFDAQSDVDFLTITSRKPTCEELVHLTDLHCELNDDYPSFIMEGSYVDNKDLGLSALSPYFDGFMMTPASIGALNPITWWLVREKGICLKGIPPENLTFQVTPTDLVHYVYENMNSYWKKRMKRLEPLTTECVSDLLPFDLDAEIEWTVFGILRQIYTLKEHRITSKLGAGKFGLEHLPAAFHPIIHEAIRIRQGEEEPLYISNIKRVQAALHLSRYLFELADTLYKSEGPSADERVYF